MEIYASHIDIVHQNDNHCPSVAKVRQLTYFYICIDQNVNSCGHYIALVTLTI